MHYSLASRRHLASLRILGVSLALLGCSSGPQGDSLEISSEALTVDPSATYTIAGVASSKCVQIAGQSLANSANARLATCSNSASQQFRFALVSGKYFHIVNVASGKCLDVQAKSTANGAAVIQYTCGSGTNQQWSVSTNTNGSVRLTARHSGKVMEPDRGGTADGTHIVQATASGATYQQFNLTVSGACPISGQIMCGSPPTCTIQSNTHCGPTCQNCTVSNMACQNGACACANSGDIVCAGQCHIEDALHCGASCTNCATAVGTGALCVNHACTCSSAQVLCGSPPMCTTQSNTYCGPACQDCAASNMTCQNGACACANSGDIVCAGQCHIEDALHCGASCTNCAAAVGTGALCADHVCACPSQAQLLCGSPPVCTIQSNTHCGAGCQNCTVSNMTCQNGACI